MNYCNVEVVGSLSKAIGWSRGDECLIGMGSGETEKNWRPQEKPDIFSFAVREQKNGVYDGGS